MASPRLPDLVDKAPLSPSLDDLDERQVKACIDAEPKAVILVHERNDPNEPADVYVGVNGIGFLVQRGVEATVPLSVAMVLHRATKTLYRIDPETGSQTAREAPAYPFTWIGGRPAMSKEH